MSEVVGLGIGERFLLVVARLTCLRGIDPPQYAHHTFPELFGRRTGYELAQNSCHCGCLLEQRSNSNPRNDAFPSGDTVRIASIASRKTLGFSLLFFFQDIGMLTQGE